jgi:hypothetical protein
MTDSNFPLQLWDLLTPQVKATLNMLCRPCIDPSMLAYEAVYGPYDWNRFPHAPPGCKAVIYKAPEMHGSWASHGINAWYTGSSLDTFLCPKQGHTIFPALQSSFLNTVKSRFSCGMNTYKKSPMNSSQHYKCLRGNNLVSCLTSNQNWHSPTLSPNEHSCARCTNGCYPRVTFKGCLLFPPLNKRWNKGWTMPPLPTQSGTSWMLLQSWQPLTLLPNGSSN